jgi:predicted dienelactone hydrolase
MTVRVFACLLLAPLLAHGDAPGLLTYRDADGKAKPVATAADWAKRRAQILANMQEVMGPLPADSKKAPLDPKVIEESDEGTYVRQKVTIAVEAGDRLPLYVLVPKQRAGQVPGVVCLHPTSRALGKGIPTGFGDKPDRHYAVHLAERGYVALAPDYVNSGEYKVDPYKAGYASATMKGIWNHMRCVDYLQTRPEVRPDRIGAIGHSLGGHNSIFLGVFDERVKCIVSNCGFCSFPTYMKGDLTGWSHDGYMPRIRTVYDRNPAKMPWDFPEAVGALAPRAFLASAPVNDHNFDVGGVKDCLAAAAPVYELLGAKERLRGVYPAGGHDFPDDARKAAYEWLDRWLEK